MDFINTKDIKKLLLMSFILPSICAAQPVASIWHGFYAGATTATTSTSINNQLTFYPAEVENSNLYNRNQYASSTQVQPGFLVGYEHIFNNYWLAGGEFQANFLKSYINSSGTDYVNNVVTANNQFALQLRGGISLTDNDNIIYALVGVAYTQTGVKIIFDNANTAEGTLGHLQMSPLNSSRNLTGLKFGVGYEKHVTNNLAMRIDYSHTQYGTFKNELNDDTFFDVMGPLGNSSISQSTDMLGLTIMFLS